MQFRSDLKKGEDNEGQCMKVLNKLGYGVFPLCKGRKLVEGRGPVLVSPDGSTLAMPDIWAVYMCGDTPPFNLPREMLIDAKKKDKCTYGYNWAHDFCSGINRKHYEEYGKVEDIVKIPVWMMHVIDKTSYEDLVKQYCPEELIHNPPTGIYMHHIWIDTAVSKTNSELVYWVIKKMIKIEE